MPEAVPQLRRDLVGDRDVPAAHEDGGDGANVRIESGLDPPLDPLQVGIRGRQVLVAVEQQGDVDRHTGEDRLLDRGQALGRPGDLDEQVVPLRLGVEVGGLLDRRLGVVGDRRRHLEGNETVDRVGLVVDAAEGVGRAAEVGDRELEEDRLRVEALALKPGDLLVVGLPAADRLVEDRRVGGQPGDVQVADVAVQGAVVEDPPGDVVEPDALAQVVELLRGLHFPSTSLACSATLSGVNPNLV